MFEIGIKSFIIKKLGGHTSLEYLQAVMNRTNVSLELDMYQAYIHKDNGADYGMQDEFILTIPITRACVRLKKGANVSNEAIAVCLSRNIANKLYPLVMKLMEIQEVDDEQCG